MAQRPKFKKYFAPADLEDLLTQLQTKAEFIPVFSIVTICRDVKDNFLLALAIDGKATHLLTGDKDLLVLREINKTQILTIADYITEQ